MLTWGAPGAFWLVPVLPLIILLYFLRLRFRRQPVSSTYLWQRLQRSVRRSGRLRWWPILLLLWQLVAASAAILAAAQPVWVGRRPSRPGTVFLLDASASMAAKDGGRTRFDRARDLLAGEIRRLPAGAPGAIFLCGPGAVPLCAPTTDRRRLLAALRRAKAGCAGFGEESAAASLQAWLTARELPWRGRLYTDGGLELAGTRLAEVFDGNLGVVYVGKSAGNLGVTEVRLAEPDLVRFQLVNNWPDTRPAQLRVTCKGQVLAVETRSAPPGVSLHAVPLRSPAPASGVLTVGIEENSDAFALDDRAYLALNPPARLRVLLVGPPNPFLRAAFRLSGVDLTEAAAFPGGGFTGEGWDLVVADRVKVPAATRCNMLCFGCLPPDAPVRWGAEVRGTLAGTDASHPLLRFVSWGRVEVAGGRSLRPEPGTEILAAVDGQPLAVAWERGGYRGAAFGTTLFSSDLGLSGAFPVFLRNYLTWCHPQVFNPLVYTLTVGFPADLSGGPSWRPEGVGLSTTRDGPIIHLGARVPGAFVWRESRRQGVLAANLPPGELDLAPRVLTGRPRAGSLTAPAAGGRRTLGRWFLLLMALALAAEWVLWRGGPGAVWRGGVAD
ncbi:MAG: vWA domain-containing protein, partial [Bacteroidota bacterium]